MTVSIGARLLAQLLAEKHAYETRPRTALIVRASRRADLVRQLWDAARDGVRWALGVRG